MSTVWMQLFLKADTLRRKARKNPAGKPAGSLFYLPGLKESFRLTLLLNTR